MNDNQTTKPMRQCYDGMFRECHFPDRCPYSTMTVAMTGSVIKHGGCTCPPFSGAERAILEELRAIRSLLEHADA
jgi:hypothetical protein